MTEIKTSEVIDFAIGDWIVHWHHGVGQIEDIERKRLGNQENTYVRIKSADIIFWMPVDELEDTEQIRSLADESSFQEALQVLNRPPKEMASNLKSRQARIKQVAVDNMPRETARLIRDLRARRRVKKGLNHDERRALRDLTKRFLQEWSLCIGLSMGKARRALNRKLGTGQADISGQGNNGRDKNNRRGSSPLIEALATRDDKWSEWMDHQLVEGA